MYKRSLRRPHLLCIVVAKRDQGQVPALQIQGIYLRTGTPAVQIKALLSLHAMEITDRSWMSNSSPTIAVYGSVLRSDFVLLSLFAISMN